MIVIVTGGRAYNGTGLVEALDELRCQDFHLLVGDASGADAIARRWYDTARRDGKGPFPLRRTVFVAEWDKYGKSAGPIRNETMVAYAQIKREKGQPILCLAAPGGRGTADCVRRCREAGFEVREVTK